MPAPGSPAPVSGPGRLARRTDGGPAHQPVRELPNAEYGSAAEFRTLQQQAPLAKAAPVPSGSPSGGPVGVGAAPPPSLLDPSMNPGQPITHGADMGSGPGTSSLGLPSADDDVKMRLSAIYSQYPSEDLRKLLEQMG